MASQSRKIYITAVIGIVAVIVVIFSSWAWLSYGSMTDAKQRVFSVLPFPAFVVEGRPVSMGSYIYRYRMAKVFARLAGQNDEALESLVFERLLQEAKIQILADRHGVPATTAQVNDEYERRRAEYDIKAPGSFEQALKDYGIPEAVYRKELVKSDVAAANLTAWFYAQRGLNASAYDTADKIADRASRGEKFETLVSAYSQDSESKKTGGDIGFVALTDLLPEVQRGLAASHAGDVKIIPTRYGIEVVKIEQTDMSDPQAVKMHVRQIFLQGSDFVSWYKEQARGLKVVRLVNL